MAHLVQLFGDKEPTSMSPIMREYAFAVMAIFLTSAIALAADAQTKCAAVLRTAAKENHFLLDQEAAKYGLRPRIADKIYRIDGRTPEEILVANGFSPNPSKAPGGLLEHVNPNSSGTSEYVSFSLEADNTDLIRMGFLPEGRRVRQYPTPELIREFGALTVEQEKQRLSRRIEDIDKSSNPDDFSKERAGLSYRLTKINEGAKEPTIIIFYQYEANNVYGVDTASIGIAKEKEFVADRVSSSHISAYREAYLIVPIGIEPPLPTESAYGTIRNFLLNPGKFLQTPLRYGPWKTFPIRNVSQGITAKRQ